MLASSHSVVATSCCAHHDIDDGISNCSCELRRCRRGKRGAAPCGGYRLRCRAGRDRPIGHRRHRGPFWRKICPLCDSGGWSTHFKVAQSSPAMPVDVDLALPVETLAKANTVIAAAGALHQACPNDVNRFLELLNPVVFSAFGIGGNSGQPLSGLGLGTFAAEAGKSWACTSAANLARKSRLERSRKKMAASVSSDSTMPGTSCPPSKVDSCPEVLHIVKSLRASREKHKEG